MRYGINPLVMLALPIIMSTPGGTEKKSRLGFRAIRAFFLGAGIGFLGFIATYFMAIAINLQSNSSIFNPVALGLIVFGFILLIVLGIEWSEYLGE